MTNKEKYVDKADAKAAAEILERALWYCYAKGKKGSFKDVLYDWLSQEAEEDKTKITNDYCHFKDVKITIKAWNELIDKVRELNARLDKGD